jgi:uncharacterized membrane protein
MVESALVERRKPAMGGLITSPVVWTRTLHVLAALWLSAGVFASAVVLTVVKRTADGAGRLLGIQLARRLSAVYTVPGAVAAGLLGFYQVTAAGFGFRAGWVQASAVLYLVLLAAVLFVQLPALRKAGQSGVLPPVVAMLTHVNALLIVILVLLMAFKPF